MFEMIVWNYEYFELFASIEMSLKVEQMISMVIAVMYFVSLYHVKNPYFSFDDIEVELVYLVTDS